MSLDLNKLNGEISTKSYLEGVYPTQADTQLYDKLVGQDLSKFPHLARYFNHIGSFCPCQRLKFKPATAVAENPKEIAKDEDFDLFEDDDPEEEAKREAELLLIF
jgi:hypothetical protein